MQIISLVLRRKLQLNIPHLGGAEAAIKSRFGVLGTRDPTLGQFFFFFNRTQPCLTPKLAFFPLAM